MKLIKPSFEIIEQLSGEEGIYKQIELAGRVCWKSENKITEDSYKNFIEMLKSKQHLSVLEHGTVYLQSLGVFLDPEDTDVAYGNYFVSHYIHNPYSKVKIIHDEEWKANIYITTNYRVLVENNWLGDLQHVCEPTEYHQKRITVRFICDRGVLQEFRTHRVFARDDDDNYVCDIGNFSACAESTRYCNYSKDKFGNEVTFIIPCWLDYKEQQFIDKNDSSCSIRTDLSEHEYFIDLLLEAERTYNFLVQYCDWTPQQARAILPNSLKTELIMTGFVSDWKHFFELRCASSAHPQARELAEPLYSEFVKRGYL